MSLATRSQQRNLKRNALIEKYQQCLVRIVKKPHLEQLLVSSRPAKITSRRRTLGTTAANGSNERPVLFSNVTNKPFVVRRRSVHTVTENRINGSTDQMNASLSSSPSTVHAVRQRQVDENVAPMNGQIGNSTPSTSTTSTVGLAKDFAQPNTASILDEAIPNDLILPKPLMPLMPLNRSKSVRPIPGLLPLCDIPVVKKYCGAKKVIKNKEPTPKVNKVSQLILGILDSYKSQESQKVPGVSGESVTLQASFDDSHASFGKLVYSDDSD